MNRKYFYDVICFASSKNEQVCCFLISKQFIHILLRCNVNCLYTGVFFIMKSIRDRSELVKRFEWNECALKDLKNSSH